MHGVFLKIIRCSAALLSLSCTRAYETKGTCSCVSKLNSHSLSLCPWSTTSAITQLKPGGLVEHLFAGVI
jgi:hypothetical protein